MAMRKSVGGMNMYDVVIIGGGVVGCSIARALSKQDRKICLLEKETDLCEGTSKANSGIVHAGFDAKPGTLKAKLNVKGNQMMPRIAKDLEVDFKQNGSIVLCFDEKDVPALEELKKKGEANGVEGLQILTLKQIKEIEPHISDTVVKALYAPTGGIVCPFSLTYAMAENAWENGVEFKLQSQVQAIEKKEGYYQIKGITKKGICATSREKEDTPFLIEAAYVINAAGVYADYFHNMVSNQKIEIIARKGEYCLMDKKVGELVNATVFQLPTAMGKGILVTPTVHGNLLLGPTAKDLEDKEDISTTAAGLEQVLEIGAKSVDQLPGKGMIITSFAGLRAHESKGDFVIGEVEDAKGFIDVAGIESPGLTCAPAIGEYVGALLQELCPVKEKEHFKATRKGIRKVLEAPPEVLAQMVEENKAYSTVVCRCEMITEGEILEAIHRPLGATTTDGVKRRTRAGMGRCQAGFCAPKTVEILARELQCEIEEIRKSSGDSYYIEG